MIKKVLSALLLSVLFYSFSVLPARANKCGVNIGAMRQNVSRVKSLTKEGGWVVALGSPGDCTSLEGLFDQGLNVVIRAYNGGKKFTDEQALGWVATLGKMDTKGQKIYFMPWNEPNHNEECGNTTCSLADVANYLDFLKYNLSQAGLLDTKVVLLSPMIDKLNPRFEEFKSIYSMASGSSINAYDQFVNGPCSGTAVQNNCLYDQIGIPGPYFALESGVAGTCSPPCYRDNELIQMLNTSWPKWNSNGAFKMFAIFSYDPHRPNTWDIFSALQVKNFYATNCQPGGVEGGSINQALFDNWLAKQNLVACGGCGYATNQNYCTATGVGDTGEPEIIQTKDSLICTNFDIKYNASTETRTTISPTPTPTGSQGTVQGISAGTKPAIGNLRLQHKNLPDFSFLEKRLTDAIDRLLPAELKQNLSLDQTPLITTAKHFVTGKGGDQPNPAEEIPETEITYPGWWTSLIGESKILCGLFNTCAPPKSLTIKVAQTNSVPASGNTNCLVGDIPKTEQVQGLSTPENKDQFKTRSLWQIITKTISEIINNIIHLVTRTQTETTLENKTRGYLPGGQTLSDQSSFLDNFLPEGVIPQNKNNPLAGETKYQLSEGYQAQSGAEQINYQNQGIVRARHCLQLCSLMPADTNISAIDPICSSCNIKDYPLTSSPVSNLPVPQQSCSADKPYEIIPSCTLCQDTLFCYGNNYRLCPADSKIPAPALGSRNDSKWYSPGDFPDGNVLYNGENFPVPSGGVYVCDANVYGCVNPKCQ